MEIKDFYQHFLMTEDTNMLKMLMFVVVRVRWTGTCGVVGWSVTGGVVGLFSWMIVLCNPPLLVLWSIDPAAVTAPTPQAPSRRPHP